MLDGLRSFPTDGECLRTGGNFESHSTKKQRPREVDAVKVVGI